MLSILIPIYNFNVLALVHELYDQCMKTNLEFEIRCYDDCSTNKCQLKNREIKTLKNVLYQELDTNLGRAAIRNKLASEAKQPYLLFLDGDSGIEKKDFIVHYIRHLKPDCVFYGGRLYKSTKPVSTEHILHWKYGSAKEALARTKRNKAQYLNFQTNNFLISKSIFAQIQFDETISGYGYEDLLFARELATRNIPVIHLENEVYHLDLENTSVFLKKSENAIRNLSILYQSNKLDNTRLIKTYNRLKSIKLLGLINIFTYINKTRFLENLYSMKPRLFYFSLLKLWLFSQFVNGQEGSFDW